MSDSEEERRIRAVNDAINRAEALFQEAEALALELEKKFFREAEEGSQNNDFHEIH